jgi:hypothetical protein
MNLYCTASSSGVSYYYDVYVVDSDGSNPIPIAVGSSAASTPIPTVGDFSSNSLYIPYTVLADFTKRLRVRVYVVSSSTQSSTLYFGGVTVSHIHTTLAANTNTGPTGPQGYTGVQGETGPTGTMIFSGSGAPSLSTGRSGDFYIDLLNGIFYGPKA